MWVDAHLHMDAPEFDADREAVIARAVGAGVGLMVSAGTSVEGSRRAVALAEQYPNVRAAVRILEDEGATKGVLHCFTGAPERGLRCAAVGWMLSLARPVTFANAGALREVAKRIPIDHLLLETDAPYLAPAPMRGRRCEPSF